MHIIRYIDILLTSLLFNSTVVDLFRFDISDFLNSLLISCCQVTIIIGDSLKKFIISVSTKCIFPTFHQVKAPRQDLPVCAIYYKQCKKTVHLTASFWEYWLNTHQSEIGERSIPLA